MKEYTYTIDGKKFEVSIDSANNTNVEVTVNGEKFSVEIDEKVQEPKTVAPVVKTPVAKVAPKAPAEPVKESLKAPLPGVIQRVCVAVGDTVEEGQTLVVLEAMKMANNLDAEKGGKVTEILVEPGESVMENTPLVVIE